MPFGEVDYRGLQSVKDLISGFGERYVRNKQAEIQVAKDRADRQQAQGVYNAWNSVLNQPGGRMPSGDDYFRGLVHATSGVTDPGPVTQQAIANIHNQAQTYSGFNRHPALTRLSAYIAAHPESKDPTMDLAREDALVAAKKAADIKVSTTAAEQKTEGGKPKIEYVNGVATIPKSLPNQTAVVARDKFKTSAGKSDSVRSGKKEKLSTEYITTTSDGKGGYKYQTKSVTGSGADIVQDLMAEKESLEKLLTPYTKMGRGVNLDDYADLEKGVEPSEADPRIASITAPQSVVTAAQAENKKSGGPTLLAQSVDRLYRGHLVELLKNYRKIIANLKSWETLGYGQGARLKPEDKTKNETKNEKKKDAGAAITIGW